MLIIELLVTYIWIDMNKLIKFIYYNVFLGVAMWLIFFLYSINIWLAVAGSVVVIYFFVIVTSKFLMFINNL